MTESAMAHGMGADVPDLPEQVSAFWDRARGRAQDQRWILASSPVPRVDPLCLVGAFPELPLSFWQNGERARLGLGIGAKLVASGPQRFGEIERGARALYAELQATSAAEAPGFAPAELPPLLGGFSFSDHDPAEGEWRQFGQAQFVLPTLTYEVSEHEARLVVAHDRQRQDSALSEQQLSDLISRVTRQLAGASGREQQLAALPIGQRALADRGSWATLLAPALEAIHEGQLQKVVLSRRCAVRLPRQPSLAPILRDLRGSSPVCTLFAFRFNGFSFIGATPERLIEQRGRSISSEALAGSIDSARDDAAAVLLSRGKERWEHELVVRAIVDGLSPLCDELSYPQEPRPRALRHIMHLYTPVTGQLNAPHHILELVERLHPTPAVGGSPREAALSWIERHEPQARGWYAAPIGWFDADGNGQFDVALRSGLLGDDRAIAFAGAGIVEGSQIEEELAETELKLAAILQSLGIVSAS